MEGVGARLGRSSSRYGTTTVFNGPVRKWKKDWVPINPPSSSSSSSSSTSTYAHHNNNNHNHNNHHGVTSNGVVNGGSGNNGNGVSHLRLFKWTPLNKDGKKINGNKNSDGNDDKDLALNDVVSEEDVPKRKKFKYIPIAVLEEQKKETEENSDDEAKPAESGEEAEEQPSKSDGNDEKPDINDVPMEDNQPDEDNQGAPARQDLNELDLSLGLTSHEEEHDSDSKADLMKDA